MKTFTFFKYASAIVGFALVIAAIYFFLEKFSFIKTAVDAQGTVIELREVKSSKSSTYSPVVVFYTKYEKKIEFASNVSSDPPSYDIDESVAVLYDPTNPNKAFINDFSSLYLGSLALGVIGMAFALVGFLGLRSDRLKRKKINFLQQSGKSIMTKFIDVKLNLSLAVNDSHPYLICSQWLDSRTNEIYLFESEDIWFDPTDFIQTEEITVIIDPEDPTTYSMDISFLPKKKN
ncbi:DUF3592 domain-containing protein [Flavobacterium sp. Fl-77]|uniref:DUF3592 domain-containing protein n=1 Tax=Flavobacterium flavipigmentatum TaxID=2893884 RepID=A0AAJ2S7Q8_9FLAO|nr:MULTISPECIES: DUF3592 domain-containing protein [unclassified Flavobacterium]MDX6182697.1 DUF3592 domain-containing protein [Flavobacterium sp. Fl-33]MDX6186123.1 DUF3592 domain-containing protein [Flavobacterium sp. Fl-77]UFH38271.1 DUF3592 domain-containing protein [Flavobacterium sp. F-70]